MGHDAELENRTYLITSGANCLTMDPETGGRIVSFKSDDFEFLSGKDVHPENYGSTFWPSPQSIWNWPPPEALDNCPYSASKKEGTVIMESKTDTHTGFQFIKEFKAGENGAFNITYKMQNAADVILYAAPWEITRVKKGGLFFFPIGENAMRPKQFDLARYNINGGIAWYKDDLLRPNNYQLNIADGLEGWMAYAINNKLFVKKFQDVLPECQAPGEAEILFYVSPEADYIEIEVQGKYEPVMPQASISWEMTWMAFDIPPAISSSDIHLLSEFVRNRISLHNYPRTSSYPR